MPRVRKTAAGTNAQPVQAFTGQQYGEGARQEAMQRAMPVPAERPVSAMQPSTPVEGAGEPAQRPPVDFARLQEALRGVGGVLRQPDERPDVPFTQTLNDPAEMMKLNMMPSINRTGEIMRELSRRTGDSTFADLAAKAGL